MAVIPQRELRNNVAEVLRRAEAGEHFTITVAGRPVAELRPIVNGRGWASPSDLEQVFAEAPVDDWRDELRRMRDEDESAATEPWPR